MSIIEIISFNLYHFIKYVVEVIRRPGFKTFPKIVNGEFINVLQYFIDIYFIQTFLNPEGHRYSCVGRLRLIAHFYILSDVGMPEVLQSENKRLVGAHIST